MSFFTNWPLIRIRFQRSHKKCDHFVTILRRPRSGSSRYGNPHIAGARNESISHWNGLIVLMGSITVKPRLPPLVAHFSSAPREIAGKSLETKEPFSEVLGKKTATII
jgi:hypothetical protein